MPGELAQLLVNGLVAGTILAVPAIGFTAIYAVLRFPNFALASHATAGAYAGWLVNVGLGWPAAPAVAAAFLGAGIVGLLTDEFVLKPLRPGASSHRPGASSHRPGVAPRQGDALTAAIAAVALTIALENVVRFAFGNDLRGYDLPIQRDWIVAGLRIGPQQVVNLAIAVVVMAAVFLFLAFARMGKAMRAVADNPVLAGLKGVDADAVARLVSFVGMGLAGAGGMLLGLETSIDPLTGFRAILSIFAAAVVGGLGSIPGAVVGALTVGVGEELSLLVLDPSYRTAVGFVAILVVLTLRPRGLLGERAY